RRQPDARRVGLRLPPPLRTPSPCAARQGPAVGRRVGAGLLVPSGCSVETFYPVAARSMMSWVSTRRRHSRSRDASDLPPSALPSRRLWRLNADSACHLWPYTRFDRDPSGLGTNRRSICPRYLPPGSPACPRVLIGM